MINSIVATIDIEVTIESVIESSCDKFRQSEFDDFIANSEFILSESGFYELDSHRSNRKGSNSCYFIKTRSDGCKVKLILYIRISDHSIEPGHVATVKKYLNKKLEENNLPKNTAKRILSIVIDGVQCKDFIEAESILTKRVKDLSENIK